MASASPNLAFIKYWGKSDLNLNMPSNDSISITLTKLKTNTTIEPHNIDRFILNGVERDIPERMKRLIEIFRELSGKETNILIKSKNNFPDSCGMASSASGYAALVFELNNYFLEGKMNKEEMSEYARLGSGSASRSIHDGIVHMAKGISYHLGYWNELKVLSIVISKEKKKIASSEGMIISANTSFFYKMRQKNIQEKINETISLIKEKDFKKLAKTIMQESNEFHAVCMDSYPPIRYINDEGFKIIEKIHSFNEEEIKAAYSFDAGTNPFIITVETYLEEIKKMFLNYEIIQCN